MAITDFDIYKPIEVTSASGEPTISRALCFKITSGDPSTTGTGEVVLDWSNISSQADIGVYDENNNLLDYYFESFDATAKTAVIWVYRDWMRDGSVQAKIAYGSGPSDQSVVASMVFDKESNLQAGYLLNESSGDALDVTSNNNDGTVYGATQGQDGIVGGAYSLDGNDDNINLGSSLFDGWSAFTGVFWVYPRSLQSSESHGIELSKRGDDNDTIGLSLLDSSTTFYLDASGGSVLDGSSVSTGQWVMVVISYDGSTMYIDIDASLDVKDSNLESGSISSTSNDVRIGGDPDSNWSDSILDCIFFYDAKLALDDIKAKYDSEKSSPNFFSQQAAAVVATDSPTNATSFSATLNGTLEDLKGNSSLDVYFEYGTDTSYGSTTTAQTISSVPTSFSADISGLTKFGEYHYRAVATDGSNYWYGNDVSFYTYDIKDVDETQSEFQNGTLTDVEADNEDYLRLAGNSRLSFAGDDYVETSFLGQSNPCSFAFWFLPNDNTRANLFGNYASGSNDFAFEWGDTDNEFRLWDDSGGSNLNTSGNFSLGNWHHVVVRCDSDGNMEIVVNKNVAAGPTSGHNGLLDSGQSYWIAGRPDDAFYLQDGSVDDLRIYSKYLSDTDISNLYDGNDVTDSLIRHWPFDEGSGDIAYETTGNGSNADIYGASWESVFSSGNRVVQLDLSSLSSYSDSLIEWTVTFPQVADSVSLSNEWTQTTNLNVKTDRVYEGDYSVGQDSGNSIDAILEPDELSGGVQTSSIEFYWQETDGQTGFAVQFVDSSGQTVMEAGGNNPQWELNDGDGSTTPYDGDGYDRWIYYKFEFDWGAGKYTYHLEDLQSGTTKTGTRSLMVSTDIESIKINNSNWGSATYIWFDKFVIGGTEANIVDVTYADPTSLTIETRYSLDGGSNWSSWQTATNGDPIPGLSSGEDLSNALLECRETLSTSDIAFTPQLERRAIYLAESGGIILTASAGSYSWSGTQASAILDAIIKANSGSYTWTGDTAQLARAIPLAADPASYQVAGASIAALWHRLLGALAGSYSLSGIAASTSKSYLLVSEAGSLLVSGADANLALTFLGINAEPGIYSLSGADATQLRDIIITGGAGAYSLSGADAATLYERVISALSGTYTISGQDFTDLLNRVLQGEPGSYQISGVDAATLRGILFSPSPGSYTLTGQDATFLLSKVLDAVSGSYSITPGQMTVLRDVIMSGEAGAYTLDGASVDVFVHVLISGRLRFEIVGHSPKVEAESSGPAIDTAGNRPRIVIEPKYSED